MPFISREDAAYAYANFAQQGLPKEGHEFEKALVRIFFKEIGGEPLTSLYFDNMEYSSYQKFTKSTTKK